MSQKSKKSKRRWNGYMVPEELYDPREPSLTTRGEAAYDRMVEAFGSPTWLFWSFLVWPILDVPFWIVGAVDGQWLVSGIGIASIVMIVVSSSFWLAAGIALAYYYVKRRKFAAWERELAATPPVVSTRVWDELAEPHLETTTAKKRPANRAGA